MASLLALIVEDDPPSAKLFTRALEDAGFETKTVYDGQTALEQIDILHPDVVILDLHLPQVSGQEVLQYIRAHDTLGQIPIVLVSGDVALSSWLHEQADFALTKPINFRDLRTLSRRLRQTIA